MITQHSSSPRFLLSLPAQLLAAPLSVALLLLASGCPSEGEGEGEGESGAIDNDEDGYTVLIDCDDDHASAHPGGTEVCGNGVDEDCSGADLACDGCPDTDSDTHADLTCGGDDCDDDNGDAHPGALDTCGDGVDQDCSGADTPCQECDEGAVAADECLCGGILRQSGYCCSDAWRATPCTGAIILWTDRVQDPTADTWGFDGVACGHPISNAVPLDNDANGASLTRVENPLPGGGYALRFFGTFDEGGSRAQTGIYSFTNPAFGSQATSGEGVYAAQEWYFPQAISAGGDLVPWLNLWDWHTTGGGDRWHTSPGLMLAEDGTMRVRWEWGNATNTQSSDSTISLPVGEWFDIEMYYHWSTTATTLRLWINGELALEQSGVITRAAIHENVETYLKWYGSNQGAEPWSPAQAVRYARNFRVAAGPISH